MRLLDLVHQADRRVRLPTPSGPMELPSPCDFREAIAMCPLRLVLTDALTRTCAELAYADGDRLVRCLDLVRLPADRLWVEWDDRARADLTLAEESRGRAGMLVDAQAGGRRAVVRTFFTEGDEVRLAAMTTHVDLDAGWGSTAGDPFTGADVPIDGDEDPALVALLACLRFRLQPEWADYYGWQRDPAVRREILRGCMGSVARDVPVLLALLLLMSTRAGLPQIAVDRSRLNAARRRSGKQPLLEHVEVQAPVFPDYAGAARASGGFRHAPRLHHVRGHLVRRADVVFWRNAHLRGDARQGVVQSRTVTLHFGGRDRRHAGESVPMR